MPASSNHFTILFFILSFSVENQSKFDDKFTLNLLAGCAYCVNFFEGAILRLLAPQGRHIALME